MASLFQTMTLERVTLDDALELLSLPRVVGVDPADGVEITAQNGKFGPYLRRSCRRQEGQPQPRRTRSSCSRSALDEAAGRLRPAQDCGGGQVAKPPLASSASIPSAASRWWSRTGASGPTSPTARPTRRCARPTTSRRSPTSGPPSCCRTVATRGRRPRRRPRSATKKKAPRRRRRSHRQEAPAKKAAAKKASRAITPAAVADGSATGDDPF